MVYVRLTGAERLKTRLRSAAVAMDDMTALNRAAAQTVLPVARNTTPVGDPKNGHIKSTLRVGATKRSGTVRAGNKRLPYGGVLHWGNPYTGQEAQPWIMLAARNTEPTWLELYFDGLLNALD